MGPLTDLPQLVLLVFIAITFLQSGLDKILDWKGNLSWLKSHFSKTFLASVVPLLLATITLAEIITGTAAIIAVIGWFADSYSDFALYSALGACITLLMLLFGQRVAKDYDGARTIVIYFVPCIFLLFLLV